MVAMCPVWTAAGRQPAKRRSASRFSGLLAGGPSQIAKVSIRRWSLAAGSGLCPAIAHVRRCGRHAQAAVSSG